MGLVGAIIIFIVLASSFIKSLKRIRNGDVLVEKTRLRLEKIDDENRKLAEQFKIAQSDEFMEKQFRDKLGLAKEGEIIIVLPEASILRKLSPSIPEEEKIKLRPNWQKWIDLFK